MTLKHNTEQSNDKFNALYKAVGEDIENKCLAADFSLLRHFFKML